MKYFFQEQFKEHLRIEKNQEQFFFSKNISRTFQERSHPDIEMKKMVTKKKNGDKMFSANCGSYGSVHGCMNTNK